MGVQVMKGNKGAKSNGAAALTAYEDMTGEAVKAKNAVDSVSQALNKASNLRKALEQRQAQKQSTGRCGCG